MPSSTVGVMTGNGIDPCFILEDEGREIKIKGETRIPAGTYFLRFKKELTPLTVRYRKKYKWFSWHIEIVGIKGFSSVYYHVGNREKDTDGCPLLGTTAILSDDEATVASSAIAFAAWYKSVSAWLNADEQVIVQITDPRPL